MKKARRILSRVCLGLLLFISLAALLCLDLVDHRPYVKQPYYKETVIRLQTRAATNRLAFGELSAGFGRAKLTPPTGQFPAIPLAGYGNRKGKPATGVHDDLFVKAVAIRVADRTAIMFGIDALIVPREVSDAAAAELEKQNGLAREHLYFSATHTHCSLGAWGEGIVGEMFAGKFDPNARTWFIECIVKAARDALSDLKPAEFARGHFAAPEFIRNRLVGDAGQVDPEFSYLFFKQRNGRVGVLGSYSAHATVLSGANMEFSADYPGYWQRALEDSTSGVAIFLAGGVGSHGPVPGDKAFAGARRMGTTLAQKTLSNLSNIITTNAITFGALSIDAILPPLNTRLTDGIRLRPWLSSKLLPPLRDTFVQAFRLNDVVWISTPCDYSGELALGIKDMLRARGFDGVVTSFNGDYVGYVIPSRYYHLNGYEPRVMSFYGPNVPDYLDELARSLALDLTPSR